MDANRRSTTAFAATALVVALALAGCAPTLEVVPDTDSDSSATPSATPTPEPDPTLDPDGSAEDNLAYFDFVNQALLAQNPAPGGRGHIDALVAAGFDKAAMQVTPDTTPTRTAADNIEFSVLFEGECLLGQSGLVGYNSTVLPALGTGSCLVGITRPIDW